MLIGSYCKIAKNCLFYFYFWLDFLFVCCAQHSFSLCENALNFAVAAKTYIFKRCRSFFLCLISKFSLLIHLVSFNTESSVSDSQQKNIQMLHKDVHFFRLNINFQNFFLNRKYCWLVSFIRLLLNFFNKNYLFL